MCNIQTGGREYVGGGKTMGGNMSRAKTNDWREYVRGVKNDGREYVQGVKNDGREYVRGVKMTEGNMSGVSK